MCGTPVSPICHGISRHSFLVSPVHEGRAAYHINEASCIKEDNTITHRTVDGEVITTNDFLPLDRPARVGVTSGASTPDSVVQEALERIVLLKKLQSVQ